MRADRRCLLLVVAVAAAVRFVGLGTPSLWLDEAYTFWLAHQPWAAFWTTLRGDTQGPLYFWLQHAWDDLARLVVPSLWQGEGVLRILPALLGCGSAACVFLHAAHEGEHRSGLLAGLFYAVSWPAWSADTQVRNYALLGFATALSGWCLLEAVQTGGRRRWIAYVLSSTLLVYSHNLAVCVLLAHLLAFPRRPVVLSLGVVVLLYAGWVPLLLQQSHSIGFQGLPPLSLPLFLQAMASIPGVGPVGGEPLLLVGTALTLAVVALGWRLPRPSQRLAWFVVVVAILGPLVATVATTRHVFLPRYLLPAVPALAVLAGGTASARSSWLRAAVVLLMLYNLVQVELCTWVPQYWRQDFRDAVATLSARMQPGDGLLLLPGYALFPVNYYLHTLSDIVVGGQGMLGYQGPVAEYGLSGFDEGALAAAFSRHPRLWLLKTQSWIYDPDDSVVRWLSTHGRFQQGWVFRAQGEDGTIRLGLYVRSDAAGANHAAPLQHQP